MLNFPRSVALPLQSFEASPTLKTLVVVRIALKEQYALQRALTLFNLYYLFSELV